MSNWPALFQLIIELTSIFLVITNQSRAWTQKNLEYHESSDVLDLPLAPHLHYERTWLLVTPLYLHLLAERQPCIQGWHNQPHISTKSNMNTSQIWYHNEKIEFLEAPTCFKMVTNMCNTILWLTSCHCVQSMYASSRINYVLNDP